MPWCPGCRTEYMEGFKTCSDCGAGLVDELEPPEEVPVIYDSEAFLMSTADSVEAGVIESLLKSYNIPVLMKHKETGAYLNIYMGMSSFGVELYVPESKLEEAKEIIGNNSSDIMAENVEEADFNSNEIEKKRRNRTKALLLLFLLSALAGIIISVFYLMFQ